MAVGVDAGGHEGVHVDHAPALMDFEDQGVGGNEGVQAGVQGAGAERLHLGVQIPGIRLTCELDRGVMPRVSISFSVRHIETPRG